MAADEAKNLCVVFQYRSYSANSRAFLSRSVIRGLCLAASVPVSGAGLVHRIVKIDKTADVSSPVNMAVLGLGLKRSLVA